MSYKWYVNGKNEIDRVFRLKMPTLTEFLKCILTLRKNRPYDTANYIIPK